MYNPVSELMLKLSVARRYDLDRLEGGARDRGAELNTVSKAFRVVDETNTESCKLTNAIAGIWRTSHCKCK